MRLSEAATYVEGVMTGEDVSFVNVSTDSRTLEQGDLYVALKGARFNGHHYVAEAAERGACALIVSETVETSLPTIKVKDTLRALGLLGAAWKAQYNPKTIAVTGSCGKTTVKEMLHSILSEVGKTMATQGNFNNEIGVPLTLLRISAEDQFAVVELGASHLGEIANTSQLAQPDIALITNAASAHIEGFGSKENIAKAKGEIYSGLRADGIAIVNLDDANADYWLGLVKNKKVMTFSLNNDRANVYARNLTVGKNGKYEFDLQANDQEIRIHLPLLGRHNVNNALAAATAALAAGATIDVIKTGLEKMQPIPGRMFPLELEVEGGKSSYLIDDSYNANPASVKAAVDLLKEIPGYRCVVLGDMAELGIHATTMHSDVGRYIAEAGIECLIVKGKHSADYLVGFTEKKSADQIGKRFDTFEEIAELIATELAGATVLVKGSRSATMERVIESLRARSQSNGEQH